jgi:phosphonate transport system permease protein
MTPSLSTAIALTLSWRALEVKYGYIGSAPRELGDMFNRIYPPNMGYSAEIVGPLIETVHISVLGTILATVLAIPVAYLGAENTTPNRFTYALGKFIIAATRSVNVIIYALIFVIAFGLGALAGVLALAVRSIGFIAKLLAEAIEEIDRTQVEAIAATGATGTEQILYGILPQIKPTLVGVVTYRWDINVRASTILGFVAAGGIGVELLTKLNSFQWHGVATILLVILNVVLVSEGFSAYVRNKIQFPPILGKTATLYNG